MSRYNWFLCTGVGLLLSAGLVEACGSTHYIDVPDDPAGAAGKLSHAGASSVAGQSSAAGEASELLSDGGAAGRADSDPEEGGAVDSAGQGGTAPGGAGSGGGTGGSAGNASGAGGASSASGGIGGVSGSGGASAGSGGASAGSGGASAGSGGASAGSGGKAGTGGTGGSGGVAGGSGGVAGSGGSGGSAGALLVLPASANCAAGNVQAAFSVCRNCHVQNGQGPFNLVTLADIQAHKDDIVVAIGGTATPATMPLAGTLTTTNKSIILSFIAAGAMGVPNSTCQ